MGSNLNLEQVKQRFDQAPFPDIPLDYSPRGDSNFLFPNSLMNATYLRERKVVYPDGKLILDAGCGSGVTSLALAEANPNAKIVGIDISQASIDVAKQRMQEHGCDDRAEFYVMPLENLPDLGLKFDYINCDETLYLLPDPQAGLNAMRSVLHEHGTMRANLHSIYQRSPQFRAQKLFQRLGIFDENSKSKKVQAVREIMTALKDTVELKQTTWIPSAQTDDTILSNFLLPGDKGFNILDMFALIGEAELEFISMVNWKYWDVLDLFKDRQQIPEYLDMVLSIATEEQKLHIYELMHPVHRLLDFWCGHPDRPEPPAPVWDWDESTWRGATAHLHPILKTERLQADLEQAIAFLSPLHMTPHFNRTAIEDINLFGVAAACLKLLWERPKPIAELVQDWLKLKPTNWLTMQPVTEAEAFTEITQALAEIESFMFILLEA
ncbi:MAG: class I SAM-dependent methyltransferase [Pseudanabaena sp. RU_4_16]|nr:class I SAM-dependent methyltransferase [Pseudanabaena sp. RU_4_16]